MTTQRYVLTTALPTPFDDHDRYLDDHTIYAVEHTVHELLEHAQTHSSRLLWSTFNARVMRLEKGLPAIIRVTIAGVVPDVVEAD